MKEKETLHESPDALREACYDLSIAEEVPGARLLEDIIRSYPELRDELIDVAVAIALDALRGERAVEAAEARVCPGAVSPAVSRALSQFQDRISRSSEELREALQELSMAQDVPDATLLDDLVCRYPQLGDELTELAIAIALDALQGDRADQAAEAAANPTVVSAVVSRALSHFQNQLYVMGRAADGFRAAPHTEGKSSPELFRSGECRAKRDREIDPAIGKAGSGKRGAHALAAPREVTQAPLVPTSQAGQLLETEGNPADGGRQSSEDAEVWHRKLNADSGDLPIDAARREAWRRSDRGDRLLDEALDAPEADEEMDVRNQEDPSFFSEEESDTFRDSVLEAIGLMPPDEGESVVLVHILGSRDESSDPENDTSAIRSNCVGPIIRNRPRRARGKLPQLLGRTYGTEPSRRV